MPDTNPEIILALPSKGRIHKETLAHFGENFISQESERTLQIKINDADNISGLLLPAAEIAHQLRHGDIHLGITGEDLVRETSRRWENFIEPLARLPFARASLIVAVPKSWIDVNSMEDLDDAAISFRRKHGRRMRFATKYPRLVRHFFSTLSLIDYRLVESLGATESAPANQTAEAICDLTSSGETLKNNGLKMLTDGIIIESQAAVFASKAAQWDKAKVETAQALLAKMRLDATKLQSLI